MAPCTEAKIKKWIRPRLPSWSRSAPSSLPLKEKGEIMSADEKSGTETSETLPSQQGKDTIKETLATRVDLEELKSLLGEEFLTQNQHELDLLMKSTQETVKKKGEGWVKKNRGALLRQWEYVRTLL
jgi:hypothetical protein